MTPAEEQKLIKQVSENNIMLKSIINYLNAKHSNEFGMNILANVIGNAMTDQK